MDPHKTSGQNLYRQFAGKKGKVILDARWVHECIKSGHLHTFQNNFAGCKITGLEQYVLFHLLLVYHSYILDIRQNPIRR